jgi:hypothetical protein
MKECLIVGAVAAFAVTSAFAQIAGTDLASDFYVVRDATTKKCTVVSEKPTETTTIRIVDNGAFKSRTEAETGMKTMKVCAENR